MNPTPDIPPVIGPHKVITYELTRRDIFAHTMTVVLRNRILQVFLVVIFFLNGGLLISPKLATDSPVDLVLDALVYSVKFFALLIFTQVALGLAIALIPKHRGVLGAHVMEITDQGLIERTDVNETLHRWPSIGRIMSMFRYLFVYVSETNSHVIPKRCFSPAEIDSFEADLRQRAGQAK